MQVPRSCWEIYLTDVLRICFMSDLHRELCVYKLPGEEAGEKLGNDV